MSGFFWMRINTVSALWSAPVDSVSVKNKPATILSPPLHNFVIIQNKLLCISRNWKGFSSEVLQIVSSQSDLGGMAIVTVNIVEKDEQLDPPACSVVVPPAGDI